MRVLNEEDLFYGGLIHVPSVHFDLLSLISTRLVNHLETLIKYYKGKRSHFRTTPLLPSWADFGALVFVTPGILLGMTMEGEGASSDTYSNRSKSV